PKIICDKFLKTNSEYGLIDYKFYCFNGEPSYIKVVMDRFSAGYTKQGIYDMNFNQLPYCIKEVDKITELIDQKKKYYMNCEIASKLSENFYHVRVDLYNIEGKIYFGELTFYDTS